MGAGVEVGADEDGADGGEARETPLAPCEESGMDELEDETGDCGNAVPNVKDGSSASGKTGSALGGMPFASTMAQCQSSPADS